MRTPAAVTATGALLLCAACGGAPATTSSRTWQPNARQLVEQLRGDVDAVRSVGASRRAFVAGGEMYILLVAYSDLSACSSMASATAAPERVVRVLAAPCAHLEHASALFTQAEAADDTRVLARAAREATRAQPALVRAAAAVG